MSLPRELLQRVAKGQAAARDAAAAPAPEWPVLDKAALHGVAGDFVRVVEPHTEADPVALLAQFLAYFGNAIGPSAHVPVEADRHAGNLFVAIVGETSRSRKGTSSGHVRRLWRDVDGEWLTGRVVSGLSSGEGLIFAVRDPLGEDAGAADRRLLVYEGELASTLRVLARDGNTLSPILRNAWDGRTLQTLTRTNPMRATDPHVSVVAHITTEEVRRYLTATERANGLGNRFQWIAARRATHLPEGGSLDTSELAGVVDHLGAAVEHARRTSAVRRDPDARALWASVYGHLTRDVPGLTGALIARSEAQTTRLALIYALLDCSHSIRVEHLDAALALWRYAERRCRGDLRRRDG